ncbi:MAG: type II toxin-antitoxin system HicB family antitoxin [Methylococcaceae bacterium]
MFCYPVNLEKDPDSGQVIVDFIDIPFAHSVGDDEDEALLNAIDALETAFAAIMNSREPIPVATPANNRPCVSVPVLIAGKVALYNAMLATGTRKADLARRLNIAPNLVDRLLSLRHKSRIEQIETALALLGKRLLVDVQ